MKRKLLSLLLVVMLVMTMSVTAFAGTQQADLTYGGEVYTVYVRCNTDEAAANIRTLCTTTTISVSGVAQDNRGQLYEAGAFNRIVEAKVTITPDSGCNFVSMRAMYLINNTTVDVRTAYAP